MTTDSQKLLLSFNLPLNINFKASKYLGHYCFQVLDLTTTKCTDQSFVAQEGLEDSVLEQLAPLM